MTYEKENNNSLIKTAQKQAKRVYPECAFHNGMVERVTLTSINGDWKNFSGCTFDGRYVYFIPLSANSTVRYDTTQPFETTAGWTAVNLSSAFNTNWWGFRSASFDGRYLYFIPDNGPSGRHGNIVRYDTTQPFETTAGWTSQDISSYNPLWKGLFGCTFDGQYMYISTFHNGTGFTGTIIRYDTTQPLNTTAGWTSFPLSSVGTNYVAFTSSCFDGRNIYFLSLINTVSKWTGTFVKYDTTQTFTASSSWSSIPLTAFNTIWRGFITSSYDGEYVYFVPYFASTPTGTFVRYNTTRPFSSITSYEQFDADVIGTAYRTFTSGTFDGRYIYYSPFNYVDIATPHGNILRYDTTKPFTKSTSWDGFDLATANSTCKGFNGGCFDGKYIYFSPGNDEGAACRIRVTPYSNLKRG